MKKIILVFLLLNSISCYSQTVKELKNIITYFLEVDDSLQIYKKVDIVKDSIIDNKTARIKTDSLLIDSYKSDVTEYIHIIIAKDKQLSNKDEEISLVKEKNKKDKSKLIKWIVGLSAGEIVTVVLIILLL